MFPRGRTEESEGRRAPCERHFGRSLLAAYTSRYMSDFILHGTSDQSFSPRLHADLMTAVQVRGASSSLCRPPVDPGGASPAPTLFLRNMSLRGSGRDRGRLPPTPILDPLESFQF